MLHLVRVKDGDRVSVGNVDYGAIENVAAETGGAGEDHARQRRKINPNKTRVSIACMRRSVTGVRGAGRVEW